MILMRLFCALHFSRTGIDKSEFLFAVNPLWPSPPQCPFNFILSPSIQTWLWSHTADILSALYRCHTQWHATIGGCERDPALCVPNIFSLAESMETKSYTCNQRPFGFFVVVTKAEEEVSDGVWLLCIETSFPGIFGCHIYRLLYLFCVLYRVEEVC